jgi:hypothetical protein
MPKHAPVAALAVVGGIAGHGVVDGARLGD